MSNILSFGLDLCKDLENWMNNLPNKLKQTPLIHLAIPGSHDSCTSAVTWCSKIAPDAEPSVQRLKFLGPLLGIIVSRWAKTQDIDINKQLTSGIRYFDLRLATRKKTDNIYIVHGQYSCNVEFILRDAQVFLNGHTHEVIILDCQHFYAFEDEDHFKLINMFKNIFGEKLLPYYSNMEHITLDYMNAHGYQIILVYRNQVHSIQPFLWPSKKLPNPWPETDEIDILIEKLNEGLRTRLRNTGYVSQCVLTPTDSFLRKNWYRTLKSTCVKPLQVRKNQWLSQQTPGAGCLNIVIADFVSLNAYQFSKRVISLNEKLLDNSFPLSQPLTPVDSNL